MGSGNDLVQALTFFEAYKGSKLIRELEFNSESEVYLLKLKGILGNESFPGYNINLEMKEIVNSDSFGEKDYLKYQLKVSFDKL